jgi:hypothetical protein
MTVTFEQARRKVDAALRGTWPKDAGTFIVAPWGFEDAESYLVVYGAREWLIGGDVRLVVLDAPVAFVSKDGGVLTFGSALQDAARIGAMRLHGPRPPA